MSSGGSSATRVSPPYRADVLTDLNGEPWRSADPGSARVKIPPSVWAGDRYSMPAASVGDVGAAMTALELAVACHSWIAVMRPGGMSW